MEHKSLGVKETNSFPQYKWHGDCSCGFHCSMPTKETAESQLASHLSINGVPYKPVAVSSSPTSMFNTSKQKEAWKPKGV